MAYAQALREGLQQATQANMQRNKDLFDRMTKMEDYKMGINEFPKTMTPEQRTDYNERYRQYQGMLNSPAGTGALPALPPPPPPPPAPTPEPTMAPTAGAGGGTTLPAPPAGATSQTTTGAATATTSATTPGKLSGRKSTGKKPQ